MTHTSTRLRRIGAGAGIGALAASTLLFAPSAQAVTEVNVLDKDVAKTETADNYTSWHQGYPNAATRAKVTAKGLELTGPSQVIKGYADNDETIGDNKNFDLAEKITSSQFTASEGVANLQVPLRSTAIEGNHFATIRSLSDEGSRIKLTDEWESSKDIGSVQANTPTPLRDIIAALGPKYKVIGFGVQAPGNAVVTDITWDGVKYKFKDPAEKLSSSLKFYRFHPKSGKIKTSSNVRIYVAATIDGKPAPKGTVIAGYAKGKKVTSGKVNSLGKVKLTLGKLPKGKATLKAQFSGSDTVEKATVKRVVQVKKKK